MGFDLIREITDGAEENLATDRQGWEKEYRGQLRERVAGYLSYLILGRIPEGWPASLQMTLMVPALGEGQEDAPLQHWGVELMDLYDAAIVGGEWSAFHQRLAEFEKLLIDKAVS
jgi:hypothetical protein